MRWAFVFLGLVGFANAEESYVAKGFLASPSATQAAAADGKFVYAVAGKSIAKLDRATGNEVARSTGEASHLNSAVFIEGEIFCAHSNFPKKPEEGDVRCLDPETMKLEVFHRFENPPGSVTWVLKHEGNWWCHFAHYALEKQKSVLVKYDADWKEIARWNYPAELVKDWGMSSLSGGIWLDDVLLATGHDKKVIYRLKVPKEGGTIEWIGTVKSPFPGQGIALDLMTGGLVGIDRKKKSVVFAELENR